MPKLDPADLDRIRKNQQRSRTRRREQFEEMQRRLADFERRGSQASLHLQRAARKVLLDNNRLRALLRAKGVTDPEVDHYLASDIVMKDTATSAPASTSVDAEDDGSVNVDVSTCKSQPLRQTSANMVTAGLSPCDAPPPEWKPLTPAIDDSTGFLSVQDSIQAQSQPSDHTSGKAEPLACHDDGRPARDTMTCAEAVTIIAGLNNTMTVEEASAQLRCADRPACRIDNLTVFRFIDQ